nr:hypothetical protein [Tanacetum cinerariifolium]
MKQALNDYDVRFDDVPIATTKKGHISIKKVPSVDNIVDILPKSLKRELFNYLRLDATDDENDDESFHSQSSFPSQIISSSSNVVPRVRQNLPHEIHDLNTYPSETINIQTQQRDAHRDGLRKTRMSVRQVWKRKTSTPKSSPPFKKDSPPLPPRVYLQSPSPPSYNPLRDQMINQLHNISTIL